MSQFVKLKSLRIDCQWPQLRCSKCERILYIFKNLHPQFHERKMNRCLRWWRRHNQDNEIIPSFSNSFWFLHQSWQLTTQPGEGSHTKLDTLLKLLLRLVYVEKSIMIMFRLTVTTFIWHLSCLFMYEHIKVDKYQRLRISLTYDTPMHHGTIYQHMWHF